jgi:hypothetical protein
MWCGPLRVGLDRATNATHGMLCNGWGTGIVLEVLWDGINPAEKG